MNILALETTTSICSVALSSTKKENPEELRSNKRSHHSENLFEFIQTLLQRHNLSTEDLDGVVVSSGPGSYTGLRIAASGVKGLLFDMDIPLFAVNTLASFAAEGIKRNHGNQMIQLHSVLDARRKHLYHQIFTFDKGELSSKTPVEITPIKEIEGKLKTGDMILGTGIQRLDENVLKQVIVEEEPAVTALSLLEIYSNAIVQNRKSWQSFIKKVSPAAFEPEYVSETQTG